MRYFRVAKLESYQHYKDRRPSWVKLHRSVLESYDFGRLQDASKWLALGLVLIASECDNNIPYDESWIARRLQMTTAPDLDSLFAIGFITADDVGNGKREKWASRYVSDEMRAAVLSRGLNRCASCKGRKNLEIDHIIPVSKGGTGDESNLQVLCRKCNRIKRNRLSCASAEQVATQGSGQKNDLRSPETETETEKKQTRPADEAFDTAWSAYPHRPNNSRAAARKAWDARIREGCDPALMLDGVQRYAAYVVASGTEPKFVKMAATFFGPGRHWESDFTVSSPVDADLQALAEGSRPEAYVNADAVKLWEAAQRAGGGTPSLIPFGVRSGLDGPFPTTDGASAGVTP